MGPVPARGDLGGGVPEPTCHGESAHDQASTSSPAPLSLKPAHGLDCPGYHGASVADWAGSVDRSRQMRGVPPFTDPPAVRRVLGPLNGDDSPLVFLTLLLCPHVRRRRPGPWSHWTLASIRGVAAHEQRHWRSARGQWRKTVDRGERPATGEQARPARATGFDVRYSFSPYQPGSAQDPLSGHERPARSAPRRLNGTRCGAWSSTYPDWMPHWYPDSNPHPPAHSGDDANRPGDSMCNERPRCLDARTLRSRPR